MGVKIGDVVKVEYILKDEEGTLIDSSEISNGGPIKIHVGMGQVFTGFEESLIGMEIGQEKEVILTPDKAFGEIDPILFIKIPKDQFKEKESLKLGNKIDVIGPNGMSSPGWIRLIEDDFVIIDMNPPLAGRTLKLNLKLVETGLEPDPYINPFHFGMSCGDECDH